MNGELDSFASNICAALICDKASCAAAPPFFLNILLIFAHIRASSDIPHFAIGLMLPS